MNGPGERSGVFTEQSIEKTSHLKINWGRAGYMELHSLVRDYPLGPLVIVAKVRWRGRNWVLRIAPSDL